jgi:hypothetical protein
MKHLVLVALISVASVLAGAGCNKPSSEDCELAIRKMQKFIGTGNDLTTAELQGEVRRCQGGSSREAVACAAKANSPEELKACSFMTPKSKQ